MAQLTAAEEKFGRDVLEHHDYLKRFAYSLTRDRVSADDLVQQTVLRALAAQNSFVPGSNLPAWLTTICRNEHSSRYRKTRREVPDEISEGVTHSGQLSVQADEGGQEESRERAARAMASLPPQQQEALRLVMDGASYVEAARRLGVDEGTIKSRVSRGRERLMVLLGGGRKEADEQVGFVRRRERGGTLEIRNDHENPQVRGFDLSEFTPVERGCEPGERPEQSWVSIEKLRIDERYQRSVLARGMTNIRKIAGSFQWRKFTPVIVALHEGVHYVIDGQHRTYAALLAGHSSVPCMIVHCSPAEAADAFAAINGNITRIHDLQIFAAKVGAGDPDAVALDRACRAEGVVIRRSPVPIMSLKPGQTIAMASLRKGMKELGEPGLRMALRILQRAHPGERGIFCAPLIKAALGVVAALQDERPEALATAARGVSFTRLLGEEGTHGQLVPRLIAQFKDRLEMGRDA